MKNTSVGTPKRVDYILPITQAIKIIALIKRNKVISINLSFLLYLYMKIISNNQEDVKKGNSSY